MLWGSPGLGKSAVVRQAAKQYAKELHASDEQAFHLFKVSQFDDADAFVNAVSLILYDPIELKGLPHVEGGRTRYTVSELVPEQDSKICVLFLDELPSAPRAVQAAAFSLVLDRKLGGHKLPKHVRIVGAGNLTTDNSVVEPMPTPLVSRFAPHIRFELSVDDWRDYANASGFHPAVIAYFGSWCPEQLYTFTSDDPDAYVDGETYACPRTAEFLSDYLYAGIPKDVETEVISGIVGSDVGAQFAAFMRVWRSLPDLSLALDKPLDTPVPDRVSACYASAIALSRRVDRQTLGDGIKYLERITDDTGRTRREFVVLMVKQAVKLNADVQNCSAFGDFAERYSDMI